MSTWNEKALLHSYIEDLCDGTMEERCWRVECLPSFWKNFFPPLLPVWLIICLVVELLKVVLKKSSIIIVITDIPVTTLKSRNDLFEESQIIITKQSKGSYFMLQNEVAYGQVPRFEQKQKENLKSVRLFLLFWRGHFGRDKTKEKLAPKYFWKSLWTDEE